MSVFYNVYRKNFQLLRNDWTNKSAPNKKGTFTLKEEVVSSVPKRNLPKNEEPYL